MNIKAFNKLFKGAYYSHKIGWRKPKVEAFSYVVNKNRLNKEKTLLIDDCAVNIESAREYGLQTFTFERTFIGSIRYPSLSIESEFIDTSQGL